MAIDIAAMTDEEKLAYAQAVGSILLASGEISTPTDFIDLALPAEYPKFFLELQGVLMDDADQISFQLSSDGGVTFHSGSSDYTNLNYAFISAASDYSTDFRTNLFNDTQGMLIYDAFNGAPGPVANVSGMASITIWPGSNTSFPLVHARCMSRVVNIFPGLSDLGNVCNAEAARQNYIRIGPYFGDGVHWTAGSYRLIGIG